MGSAQPATSDHGIEAQQDEQPIPDDIPLIELADMVVRGKVKLSPPQQRMLIEMLPFIAPKLSAVGYMREADTFATRLERAIERSNGARLIEGRAIEVKD
jgi:hypothetical protein